MPISQQYESILGFAATLLALAGVAAMVRGMTGAMAGQPASSSHHSIPPEELNRIAREYGYWAARRAEAVCPHMDVACVEREAKRLYETMFYRR